MEGGTVALFSRKWKTAAGSIASAATGQRQFAAPGVTLAGI
jgi:hypothetical protein